MMFLLQRRGSRTHPRPGVGSAIWTGYAPTVTGVTQFASPGLGAATWTGYAPDISKLATLAPGVGAATWTGPAPTVSGLQFDPATLSPTVWIDPSDLSTLWQDTAATSAVTTDSQTVARTNDKGGGGNYLQQATSSARPQYKTSGGLHWLAFDGVDDILASASAFSAKSQPVTIAISVDFTSVAATKLVLDGIASGNRMAIYSGGADAWSLYAGGTEVRFGAAATGAHVLVAEFNGSSSTLRVDATTKTITSGTTVGTHTLTGVSIGAAYNVGTPFAGKVYGALVIPRALNSTERANLETWLGAKAGLTI